MVTTTEQAFVGAGSVDRSAIRKASLTIAVICAATIVACWPSVAWLVREWLGGHMVIGHGIPLTAVSVFLLLRSLRGLDTSSIRACWWALPVVLILSVVWLLGYVADVVVVHTAAVPLLMLAGILAVLGRPVLHQVAFSILYLFFALPVWEHLRVVFQFVTAFVVQYLIQAVGISALIDGNIIQIPSGTFKIASGCSGINFIIVGLALAALYGHLYYRSVRARWLLAGIALLFAVVSNWIRVSAIIIIGDVSDMQSPLVDDHASVGWILFGILLIPLFWIASKLDRGTAAPPQATSAGSHDHTKVVPALVAVLLALATGPLWAAIVVNKTAAPGHAVLRLPEARGDWFGPMPSSPDWRPEFGGASGEVIARYENDAGPVWVYNNVYLSQAQDRELVHLHNDIAGGFYTDSNARAAAQTQGGSTVDLRDVIASSGGDRWRIWFWYEIDGARESRDAGAKLRQAFAALKGRPDAGVIAVATRCRGSCDSAAGRLADFMHDLGDGLTLAYTVGTGDFNR
ncbi:MAG: EpsI family protein [Gammaproteobacteria bacterium]|nr:EpsI family protein [Gammaproteobacteria bacterium]